MNSENERKCLKCNKLLMENEIFCKNCGELSVQKQKGHIVIKAKNVKPIGASLVLIGIVMYIIVTIVITNGIKLKAAAIGVLMSIELVPITLGAAILISWRKFIIERKSKISTDSNIIYCRHCYSIFDEESKYCFFCGSKNK